MVGLATLSPNPPNLRTYCRCREKRTTSHRSAWPLSANLCCSSSTTPCQNVRKVRSADSMELSSCQEMKRGSRVFDGGVRKASRQEDQARPGSIGQPELDHVRLARVVDLPCLNDDDGPQLIPPFGTRASCPRAYPPQGMRHSQRTPADQRVCALPPPARRRAVPLSRLLPLKGGVIPWSPACGGRGGEGRMPSFRGIRLHGQRVNPVPGLQRRRCGRQPAQQPLRTPSAVGSPFWSEGILPSSVSPGGGCAIPNAHRLINASAHSPRSGSPPPTVGGG